MLLQYYLLIGKSQFQRILTKNDFSFKFQKYFLNHQLCLQKKKKINKSIISFESIEK